ncbi:hypothetical protein CRG98_019895 [Punica granatum]|uniref:Uncharacterized protein n=1 Tax=Punica granatum TaxID=22663 RepID=A0A2I0JTS3_PUNGR|nr:hypothetical protein CRG98_019895 [Punica granatum]
MARGSQERLSATSLGVRPRGSFGLPEPTRSPRLRFKLFPDKLALYMMKTCVIRSPEYGKSRGKPEKGAWEVGSAPWNEQTRIGAVGSTGRPDWHSGLSGLYRLIEVTFSWEAGCVGFPRD